MLYYFEVFYSLQLRANLCPFIANPVTFDDDAIGVQLKSFENIHILIWHYFNVNNYFVNVKCNGKSILNH